MPTKKKDGRTEAPPAKPAEAGEYVRRVQKDTAQYVKDVLSENEKLRALVHSLESELDKTKTEQMKLQEQLSTIEAECRKYLDQYVDVELQNTNVANLYVASLRLHSTLKRDDVLSAIQEIVINLIGSEELAIFELATGGDALSLVRAYGVDPRPLRTIPLGEGIIGRAAERGERYVVPASRERAEGPGDYEEHLTACVPLVVDGRVTGAIAIFRLLEHKRALEEVDHELFGVLGTQAAMALYCTGLVEKVAPA